ncbi:MAG: hypothetical protein KDC82_09015 [Bacteroidetes bacterium]|nr:hypothetical protein [Bacteroidota bacterium]
MVEEHHVFVPPQNYNQLLWRFVDVIKFVDLLASEELYFSRADKFSDKFEGSNPTLTKKVRENNILQAIERGKIDPERGKQQIMLFENLAENQPQNIAINCWHMNDYESAAMWDLYSRVDVGIAIVSTYERLLKALEPTSLVIHIGVVNYIDYEKDIIPWGNSFIPFVHKRKSFEHEHELRAVIWSKNNKNKGLCHPINNGVRVNVDLNALIEAIYLYPNAPSWQYNTCEAIMKKFGLNKQLRSSKLNEVPVY